MNQPFDENVYLIDLSHVKTAAEIIFDLSTILDTEEARNRRICLKLGEIELNQSQILSIKSLINSINSTLSFVSTESKTTESAVLSLGIVLATKADTEKVEAPEPEKTYKSADEIDSEKDKSSDIPSDIEEEFKQDAELEYLRNKFENQNQDVAAFENKFENIESEKENITEIDKPLSNMEKGSAVFDSENIPDEYEQLSQDDYIIPADEPSTPREYDKMEDHILEEEVVEEDEVVEEEKEPISAGSQFENVEEKEENETVSEHKESDIVLNIPSSEEIKEELDNIFDKEKKLEEIIEHSESQEESHFVDIKVPEKTYTDEDFELDSFPTKYIKQTIRSGQVINFEGNIVIIGDSHPGSEIVAAGDITVWGVLSGIAHAGSKGNKKARIRALKMNAIQLRVADCYARRPDALNKPFIEKSNTFVPEEARIVNGEIVIFKTND